MATPTRVKYLIIGAGIHGLSTAWHLGEHMKAKGQTPRNTDEACDILIIDKDGIASGASGIACGVVRNNYYQPAMRELMAHSVSVWESDMEAFSYNPVGYMQISHEGMHENICEIYEQQKAIGYDSALIEGKDDCTKYMKGIFDDWQAQGITSVLHEKKGGYANNTKAMYGLAAKAEAAGARIMTGTEVTGFQYSGQSVSGVETSKGLIECDELIVGVGPWAKTIWDMMDLPKTVDIKGADGSVHSDVNMWIYWSLQEGTLGVDPNFLKNNEGGMPPVIHVDTDAPLISDEDGSVISEDPWGIYYKPDFHFNGVQGGAMPFPVEQDADKVAVDPYGPASPDFVVGPEFAHMWSSALAHCQKRFEGKGHLFGKEPSGGIGSFTPDSFPVFDRFRENVYFIADSNHGFKMLGVGALVADDIMGKGSALLEPFRFSRFAEGKLHPVSNSPYPWS
ncbi:MAG: FAD-binding oxidoreductase [Rhodospirillales bacterium]|jgi:methylglutamate dehydrogenase subunit A|nr:FAD-binding oxidoreductase [Rhodospirillales bacterium]MBT4040280.1 FAD-binding oxidoreductase [Rhodospirillales bacterium]MBT4626844.1 FAD-binding oxidoreductase [Rhodospirillales bacterium]MBT5353343.1 FAD-binding oxidoreductase [Rhodospirillales bacterium]MBT5519599.1 FAD-binding oxidoreductase [Rhodospirillales bacterium]